MLYIIDNHDSFVYNLAAYFRECDHKVVLRSESEATIEEIEKVSPIGIVISPGPKHPKDAVISRKILKYFYNKIPILGVCLGHQIIGYYFNADIVKGACPMHGKISKLYHTQDELFDNIPNKYSITRYHSLVIKEETLPQELKVIGKSEDGVIMAIKHRKYPVYGLQFHPEAVLSEYGHEILDNFYTICKKYQEGV